VKSFGLKVSIQKISKHVIWTLLGQSRLFKSCIALHWISYCLDNLV